LKVRILEGEKKRMNIDYFDAGCSLLVVFWLGHKENRGHKEDSITNSKARRKRAGQVSP